MKTAVPKKAREEEASAEGGIGKSAAGCKRPRKMKEGQASANGETGKSAARSKRPRKSTGGQCQKTSVGKKVLPSSCGVSYEDSDKDRSPEKDRKMPSDVEHKVEELPHPSAKIKLQLFPIDDRLRMGLEKDGHNPFLELTLSARKKVSSILKHLDSKWGCSSIAKGELVLLPFDTPANNMSDCRKWTSNDVGSTAKDVYAAIGSPEIFRMRYVWICGQPSCSSPSPACGEPGHLERVYMENAVKDQQEIKSKQSTPCNTGEEIMCGGERSAAADELSLAGHINPSGERNKEFRPNNASSLEKVAIGKIEPSAEAAKYEGARMDSQPSFTSLLFSDLSNISIGGLLSEVSLQGRFSTQDSRQGVSRLSSQTPTFASDSLDAFINQIKSPQAPTTIFSGTSIFNAEDTCHSFALPKASSSGKEFLSLGRSVFSQLTDKDTSSRPFKCPKSEAGVPVDVTGGNAVQVPKSDAAPVCNNENSLGLSSIRWNDSLGPFDLPLRS